MSAGYPGPTRENESVRRPIALFSAAGPESSGVVRQYREVAGKTGPGP
ncbi:hypothetical protein [Actinoplanes lobatus]|uniref:Uncharacterized protein n=1 Tax=Actinoplanes lobatus TaxID=113568 RepID=A0A7W7MGL3_9ACTN|nr:hypothetical protein [Actinoplanes lobatus]MBB4749537.1 hypothetical protein [Actinoplanes lobatus]